MKIPVFRIRVFVHKLWPFVSKKKYEGILSLFYAERERSQKENEAERQKLRELISGFMHLQLEYHRKPRLFALRVEFSDTLVIQFRPGDQEWIRYLAKHIAYNIERELLSINFATVREYDD